MIPTNIPKIDVRTMIVSSDVRHYYENDKKIRPLRIGSLLIRICPTLEQAGLFEHVLEVELKTNTEVISVVNEW